MKQEETMSGQDGLQIIHKMINQAKRQYSDNSFNYLLWGWLVFIASLGHYVLARAGFGNPEIMWVLMPLGAVIALIYNYRKSRTETVKTYADEFIKYVLIAFLVCLCIVLINMNRLGLNCYPMLMMVYGMFLFISGGFLKFRPLIWGGVTNWAIAVNAMYVDFGTQLLLLASAVMAGYIIPGHMLRNHYKKVTTLRKQTAC